MRDRTTRFPEHLSLSHALRGCGLALNSKDHQQ